MRTVEVIKAAPVRRPVQRTMSLSAIKLSSGRTVPSYNKQRIATITDTSHPLPMGTDTPLDSPRVTPRDSPRDTPRDTSRDAAHHLHSRSDLEQGTVSIQRTPIRGLEIGLDIEIEQEGVMGTEVRVRRRSE